MTYTEATDFLFVQFPQYQKVGAAGYKPGLEGMKTLVSRLGNPQQYFKSIHIAGTNGKGSVAHMLAAVLQQAGYRTGLYTSPHLTDYRERIKVNGQMISREEVISFVEQYLATDYGLDFKPSFFEITTALAFRYFARQRVDIAVIETGLGGRLDSTNILLPSLTQLCVITNIGLEHCDLLGDTLEKIAFEKAGIIKPGIPVVIGEALPATLPVFEARARKLKAPLTVANPLTQTDAGVTASAGCTDNDLNGCYQQLNRQTVNTALDVLRNLGWNISPLARSYGMAHAATLTGLHGRWETVRQQPRVVLDTGHNAHGLRFLNTQLQAESYDHLYFVLGVVVEKDLHAILPLLPPKAHYLFTQAQILRALPATELAAVCRAYGLTGEVCPTVASAVEKALHLASPTDFILIGGSNFTVGEALPLFFSQNT